MPNSFPNWITPNRLTLTRVLLIPVIYVLVFLDTQILLAIAWLLFFIACMTDYWDGLLARQTGTTTDFGRLMDPIADKILIISLLILLVGMERAPAHLTALIIVREFAVSGLRSVVVAQGVVIAASKESKYKTILQMFAVGFLILHYPILGIPCHEVGIVLLWAATLFTLWTGARYFLSYYQVAFSDSSS